MDESSVYILIFPPLGRGLLAAICSVNIVHKYINNRSRGDLLEEVWLRVIFVFRMI